MSLKVVKYRTANDDLIAIYEFIASDKAAPAERFLRVADEAFQRIAAMPAIGRLWESPHPRLHGIRVYSMPDGFRNYQICYRRVGDVIEILTIIHGARDLEKVFDRFQFE